MMKKIIIVGAGPGGLTSGMLLSHRGFDVEIFEKESKVGGRNSSIDEKGFTFDIGPTFLMMKFILEEVFEETGRKASDYMEFKRLDPMYRLFFKDKTIDLTDKHDIMKRRIKKLYPGDEKGYDKLMIKEKRRYEKMYPCLQKPYHKINSLWNKDLLKAYPYLSLGRSMYGVLSGYFKDKALKISFTFQSKYLGMSPWNCPAAFMIIPYVEHAFGVYHITGGLSKISECMAKVVEEEKGKIHLNKTVKELILDGKKVKGVKLSDGQKIYADHVILNSDFAYSMVNLIDNKVLKKWKEEKLRKKNFSCSTFMIYLGLDKVYDLPHHNIIFSDDYERYIKDISKHKAPCEDLSLYIRNASINDKTIAPKGMSNIYVLVPVSNNKSGYDWEKNKDWFRDLVIKKIKEKTHMKDIERHIVFEKIITPDDWEKEYNVFLGATFNLGHDLFQMLYFRPHNKFEELKDCYIVGGGTHPGSGLPTIYESGRITANLISNHYKVSFISLNKHVK